MNTQMLKSPSLEYCSNCESEVANSRVCEPCFECGEPVVACNDCCDHSKCADCDLGSNFTPQQIVKVRKRDTGGEYKLYSQPDGSWYLTANDGMVPSGQSLNGPLSTILEDFDLEPIN